MIKRDSSKKNGEEFFHIYFFFLRMFSSRHKEAQYHKMLLMSFTESLKTLHPENVKNLWILTQGTSDFSFVCGLRHLSLQSIIVLRKQMLVDVFTSGLIQKSWVGAAC